jgi:hypothetical protein
VKPISRWRPMSLRPSSPARRHLASLWHHSFLEGKLFTFVLYTHRRHACVHPLYLLPTSAASLDSGRFATSSTADSSSSSSIWHHALLRQKLFTDMAAGLTQHGLSLGGVVTQGLTQTELFRHEDASSKWGRPRVLPVLHPLQVRVYFHEVCILCCVQ